jgi:hypothetical protein
MRTKTTILKISTVLIISAAIFVIGCKKDSGSSSGNTPNGAQTMSANGATADGAYSDAFGVALQAGNDNNINSLVAQKQQGGKTTNSIHGVNGVNGFYCANITLATTAGDFPDTLTVDFGNGCTSSGDGITRSGSITYIYSGRLSTPGTVVTASFNNYTVNHYQLTGSYKITNNSSLTNFSLKADVTNGTITYPNDSVYSFSGTRTWTLNTPIDSTVFLNNSFDITGNYTITNASGASLTATISTPLLRQLTCPFIVSGVTAFVYTSGSLVVDGTLDYGNGVCDNKALVTIGSTAITVSLPF